MKKQQKDIRLFMNCMKRVRRFLRAKGVNSIKNNQAIRLFAEKAGLDLPERDLGGWILKIYLDKSNPILNVPFTKRKSLSPKQLDTKKNILKHGYKNGIFGIYSITSIINNKIYIGSSSSVEARWLLHKLELKNRTHYNVRLQFDYDLYGEDNFKFEILWQPSSPIDRNTLYAIEQQYIDKHSPEYNIQKKVFIPPDKTKKLSARHREMKKPILHK